MKKMLFVLLSIFALTGCTNTITYDFKEGVIESTIVSEFTDAEYVTYINQSQDHDFKLQLKDADTNIQIEYVDSTPAAYWSGNKVEFYEQNGLDYETNNNKASYKYTFNYENFKNNYFLDKCFESFVNYESKGYVYYEISGKFTCDNPETVKIKVKSDYKIIESNSDETNKGEHVWNVKMNNNSIKFGISKDEKEGFAFGIWQYLTVAVIVIVSLISAFIVHKANK